MTNKDSKWFGGKGFLGLKHSKQIKIGKILISVGGIFVFTIIVIDSVSLISLGVIGMALALLGLGLILASG